MALLPTYSFVRSSPYTVCRMWAPMNLTPPLETHTCERVTFPSTGDSAGVIKVPAR